MCREAPAHGRAAHIIRSVSAVASTSLRLVKVVHTIVWTFFAACIFAIPICAWTQRTAAAFALIGIVFVEVLVLVVNRWRCPLTGIAARYTDDRRDNFDIYLPVWLARYNKIVFGLLYLIGIVVAVGARCHTSW